MQSCNGQLWNSKKVKVKQINITQKLITKDPLYSGMEQQAEHVVEMQDRFIIYHKSFF